MTKTLDDCWANVEKLFGCVRGNVTKDIPICRFCVGIKSYCQVQMWPSTKKSLLFQLKCSLLYYIFIHSSTWYCLWTSLIDLNATHIRPGRHSKCSSKDGRSRPVSLRHFRLQFEIAFEPEARPKCMPSPSWIFSGIRNSMEFVFG